MRAVVSSFREWNEVAIVPNDSIKTRVKQGHITWKHLYLCVLVGCHLRRKVVEIAKSHEAVNRRVLASNSFSERFFRHSQKLLQENLGQIRVTPDDMTLGHQAALTVLGFLSHFGTVT